MFVDLPTPIEFWVVVYKYVVDRAGHGALKPTMPGQLYYRVDFELDSLLPAAFI